jgi:hypothetical protein
MPPVAVLGLASYTGAAEVCDPVLLCPSCVVLCIEVLGLCRTNGRHQPVPISALRLLRHPSCVATSRSISRMRRGSSASRRVAEHNSW